VRRRPDDLQATPEGMSEAAATLSTMAAALFGSHAGQQQIVLPASEPEAERDSIVEELAGAVLLLTEQATVAALSGGGGRIFGRDEADVIGEDACALLATSDGTVPLVLSRRGAALEATFSRAVVGRRADGTTFPVEIVAAPLRGPGDARVVVVVRDLLEVRQREEQIRKAQARYRALVEQLPAVTFMLALDEGTSELYVSPQIESLLGYSQAEWLSNPVLWFDRLHPDDREMWDREFARGLASGGPFRAECRAIARDGSVVWVHGEARLVRDAEGRPLFLQGIAFDITESKRAEQALREAHELRIRTERLAAIGQLAASVGHDLRNPLGAIRNAWYFIQRKLAGAAVMSDPRVARFAALIDRELVRSAAIIDDLLDFTRDRPPQLVACPLRALVDEAMSVVELPSKEVHVDNEIPESMPAPFLDPAQLRQVLVNLLQNAVDAVDVASGWVKVRASIDGEAAVIDVVDNGRGMPAEVRDRVFEPLFTTKLKGTGLGLAIVANVVKRHGGTIEAMSAEGEGTTFRVRVPFRGTA
jgi:PAS domain S-box-containing protein